MRVSVSSVVLFFGLALTCWPPPGLAQADRDFVFTDEDGHLVIRFAGTGATGLDPSQVDEVVNAEFSRMVHDRLRADLLFEAELPDPDWAASMEPRIEEHVEHVGHEFSDILVECRASSCRVIMEQPGHWSVPAQRAVLESVQASIEAFIAGRRHTFEPVFMITAYDQGAEKSHHYCPTDFESSPLKRRRGAGCGAY